MRDSFWTISNQNWNPPDISQLSDEIAFAIQPRSGAGAAPSQTSDVPEQ